MNNPSVHPFLTFLQHGSERGGFETDDVLAAVLPLMRQVLQSAQAKGLVAPLRGLADLEVKDGRILQFAESKIAPVQRNSARIEQLQAPASHGVEVVAEVRRTADLDSATLDVANLGVGQNPDEIKKPVYLAGYQSWEHAVGHHDELTDIFSLGLILASLGCGLDFTEENDVEVFANHRDNLFALNARLHPVLAAVIGQMTELNRHRRAQHLAELISRLENYRDQQADMDLTRIEGFKEAPLDGKRRLIQSRLRDRLFDISRRNRLIFFKPSLHTLNLTIASVPLVLDYQNIKLEQLFVWHRDLAAAVAAGGPLSLGKYLRFEDAPYISGVLDKIISEARHDRAEFGFAQLRLVICFLHWHNLKEDSAERIHSPLLLLPVTLSRKKGVRDNYVLEPTGTEAEVNPALRHHLKELYNLDLPETVDLREATLQQFHQTMQAQIRASEPAVTLNLIERPQIQLIHERARQRVDQYRRRMKLKARPVHRHGSTDYSYEREHFRPLGLQIFLQKIRPTPAPLRQVAGAPPPVRLPHIVAPEPESPDARTVETERQTFALRERDGQNPYSWDFDLCSLTLGNFNYRKMTLVRDYSNLIETNLASTAFDTVFSLSSKPPEEPPPLEIPLTDQHLIIACDATQASAIARARSGRSYIIQGPPGTGKSQTITNLIADYVAQGKRVLFVCEKRAAIDVVFHRLRQQGLDELCCLIHDSQTDKKEFIQNLKQTAESFVNAAQLDENPEAPRAASVRAMDQDLAALRRFSGAMCEQHEAIGIPLRSLLHRLIELRRSKPPLAPEVEETLPEYCLWLRHGKLIDQLGSALVDLGEDPCFANHPLRWLGRDILQAERPLEAFAKGLDRAEAQLDAIESALEMSGLQNELWDTIGEIRAILDFAVQIRPLADRQLLALLIPDSTTAAAFAALSQKIDDRAREHREAKTRTTGWREPLSADDTQNALEQARGFEKSLFRFLQPSWWRLRKTLGQRYDFSRHAVAPAWVKILDELAKEHSVREKLGEVRRQAESEWQTSQLDEFRRTVAELLATHQTPHPSVGALIKKLAVNSSSPALIRSLGEIQPNFVQLNEVLGFLLAEYESFDLPGLMKLIEELRDQSSLLPELLPVLTELAELPVDLLRAIRQTPVPLNEFEAVTGHRSLNQVYRQDRLIGRVEGRTMARRMERLREHHRQWLALNARCIRAGVRRKFLEHVNLSGLAASQLNPEQKVFKRNYSAGRRDLEHEFGKTMRYKSIRELAAGNTGQVIQDLKPVWLMSPLSVSDTLPLDPDLFDVVIFDEASQIPVEEAIPAVYRSHQVIVVGDEMQLPPTTFFSSAREEEDSVVVEEAGERFEVDLNADSFLTQSASNLPSTLLAWHYRSRYESLISFSNAAFYSGNLFTIPDRQLPQTGRPELRVAGAEEGAQNADALLQRPISFHFMEKGAYVDRRNGMEAAYIAQLVRTLLAQGTKLSIGIVAFSEAQQSEIEDALQRLAAEDSEFGSRLDAEIVREENDQFCGLFVKNLENVQGDERDIIILSICYGYDLNRKMLMNFGPINQRGGEKRLNVIFSRAKHHLAVVTSIRHLDITNDYNDGANSLKSFLQYAEDASKGDERGARRVLENLNPLARKSLAPHTENDAVVEQLAGALRQRGHTVEKNVGQSKFRCDLAIRSGSSPLYELGILVDTDAHYANPNLLDRYLMQPAILEAFGWRCSLVLTKDWYHDPEDVVNRIERMLSGQPPDAGESPADPLEEIAPAPETGSELTPSPSLVKSPAPDSPAAPRQPNPPLARPAARPSGQCRRLELVSGGSNKFWEVEISGESMIVRFGRIGTAGQTQTKGFPDAESARHEAERLISEKLRKGYAETS